MEKNNIIEHRKKIKKWHPNSEPAEVLLKKFKIPTIKKGFISVDLYRPLFSQSLYPTIFYLPGTAFIGKEFLFTQLICSHMAEKSNCQVIVIYHRLAPEFPFPAAILDTYHFFSFCINAEKNIFNIDKTKIVMVGYSSGGNLAVSVAIFAIRNNLPLHKLILISPLLDMRERAECHRFPVNDKAMNYEFIRFFSSVYLSKKIDRKNPWVSPLFQKMDHLKLLPFSEIIFGEEEHFREEIELYISKLHKAEVHTKTFLIPQGDHALLWVNRKVTHEMGLRIKEGFFLFSVPRPISKKSDPYSAINTSGELVNSI